MAGRPHSQLPLTVFGEVVDGEDARGQLFGYYLLDTTGFQPNVFTRIIGGINDNGVIQTGANAANGGLPTIGAVRVILEPKPGLPTDPDDPKAFIDMFTDISGLFVINNESGWYENWMIHDLRVPPIAPPLPAGRARYGTMTPADAGALAAMGSGHNVAGNFFTTDGNAVRFPSAGDVFPSVQGNTVAFPVSVGSFNSQQQSDAHAYWEFNRGTNWIFPHYELPFTGGVPGTFPSLQYGLQSVVPGSGPFGVSNSTATHEDDPDKPARSRSRRPGELGSHPDAQSLHSQRPHRRDHSERVRAARVVPAGVTDVGERLLRSYAIEVARVDQNGDGVLSFAAADVEGFSDGGLPNARLYLSPRSFNRFAVTREINDGLLAPRFAPSQRAYVLGGFLTLVCPAVPASVPIDADLR
jgi:hypothetical protein